MTEWRAIAGFPGYEVSDDGRVRRTVPNGRNHKPQELKAGKCLKGYRQFQIGTMDVRRTVRASKLVLTTFVGPRPPGYHACHNDGCNTNDCLSNLRWDTPKANQADRVKHGTALFGEKNHATKLSPADIERIREAKLFGTRWTGGDLAQVYGVNRTRIWQLVAHA